MIEKNKQRNLLYVIVVVFIIEAILFYSGDKKINKAIMVEETRMAHVQEVMNAVTIGGKAFSVYDLTADKKIYGRNDDVAMPLASLAKIMTIITVLNTYSPDDIVSISDEAVKQDGNYGLLAGEKWRVGDLAKLTLVISANDGAYTLSENIPDFLKKINEKAQKIGAHQTLFLNATGLDINASKAGVFGSAEDVNIMASFAYKDYPDIFRVTTLPEIVMKSESGFEHTYKNTDTIISNIPNLLFSKTGYTNVAGGNLSIIFQNQAGHDIAVTILGSTFDGRFVDMKKIVDTLDPL